MQSVTMLRLGRHVQRLTSANSSNFLKTQAGQKADPGFSLPRTLQHVRLKSNQAYTVESEHIPIKKLLVANRGMCTSSFRCWCIHNVHVSIFRHTVCHNVHFHMNASNTGLSTL